MFCTILFIFIDINTRVQVVSVIGNEIAKVIYHAYIYKYALGEWLQINLEMNLIQQRMCY